MPKTAKEAIEDSIGKISGSSAERKGFVRLLARVFLSKATTPEKIQEVQNALSKTIGPVIRKLEMANENLANENFRLFQRELPLPVLKKARNVLAAELELFTELKKEFLDIRKMLPVGLIDMETVRKKLQVDKIMSIVSDLNVLVGNVPHEIYKSEDAVLGELMEKRREMEGKAA